MYQLLYRLCYTERGVLLFYIYNAFSFCPEKMTELEVRRMGSQAKPSQASFLRVTRGLHASRSQASLVSFFKKLASPHFLL